MTSRSAALFRLGVASIVLVAAFGLGGSLGKTPPDPCAPAGGDCAKMRVSEAYNRLFQTVYDRAPPSFYIPGQGLVAACAPEHEGLLVQNVMGGMIGRARCSPTWGHDRPLFCQTSAPFSVCSLLYPGHIYRIWSEAEVEALPWDPVCATEPTYGAWGTSNMRARGETISMWNVCLGKQTEGPDPLILARLVLDAGPAALDLAKDLVWCITNSWTFAEAYLEATRD